MAEYLHTMLRITDPAKSRAFYEALGFIIELRRAPAAATGSSLCSCRGA
jgi:catechol 2,3-dioxygenase-like lactoylglutathione lyase family enzyme